MRLLIKNQQVNLNPNELEQAEVSFSFLHGRKFKAGRKVFSLNEVIQAVTKEALKPEQDKKELGEWAKVFTALTDKGYKKEDAKGNFFVMLIAKIKHYFSRKERDKLLTSLNGILATSVPLKSEGSEPDIKPAILSDTKPAIPSDIKPAIPEDISDKHLFSLTCEEIEKALPSVKNQDHALWFSSKIGNISLCKELIKKGANVNFRDPLKGETPLINAIYNCNTELVRYLLEAGAQSKIRDDSGNDARDTADKRYNSLIRRLEQIRNEGSHSSVLENEKKNCEKVISFLKAVEAYSGIGAKPQDSSVSLFIHVYLTGNEADLDKIKKVLPSIKDPGAALWLAIKVGDFPLCKDLLENRDANVNFQDPIQGNTPLIRAVMSRNTELVRYLLKAGADRTIQNKSGENALFCAHEEHKYFLGRMEFIKGQGKRSIAVETGKRSYEEILSLLEAPVEASSGIESKPT